MRFEDESSFDRSEKFILYEWKIVKNILFLELMVLFSKIIPLLCPITWEVNFSRLNYHLPLINIPHSDYALVLKSCTSTNSQRPKWRSIKIIRWTNSIICSELAQNLWWDKDLTPRLLNYKLHFTIFTVIKAVLFSLPLWSLCCLIRCSAINNLKEALSYISTYWVVVK